MRTFWPFLLIASLFMSSCTTYRLQYEESFHLVEKGQETSDDPSPYVYLYEESYAKPAWVTWGCGLTFIWYGGLCWFYLKSHSNDVLDIKEKGHQKLVKLLDGRKSQTMDSTVTNFKSTNRHLPARLRVFNPEGETIIRGEAARIVSVPSEVWTSQDNTRMDQGPDEADETDTNYLSHEEPEAFDTNYTYRSYRLGLHSGQAEVRSQVTENGLRSTIASGSSPLEIIELRTHDLARNGWFWTWAPYASSQSLKIEDFSGNLPLYQSTDGYDIPVVISDPNDQSVITNYANTYKVGLQTMGLMLGGGISHQTKLKGATEFWSISATAWFSAVDYMKTRVQYNSREVHKSQFAVLQSYQLDLDAYYNIVSWRLAIGLHSMTRVYPGVKMPDDMEFRGPARYNSDKKIFERNRMFIDELEFTSRTFGISVSYIFEEYNSND